MTSSSLLPRHSIQHVCYIVEDIPNAVDRWVGAFGAGPFFWVGRHITYDEWHFRGEPCVLDHSAVIGRWGDIFVELSQIHELSPASFEALFLGHAGSGGVGHISYIADDAVAENERLDELGMPSFFYGRQGPIEVTFHECDLLGHAIEIHQSGALIDGLFGAVAAAADGWDGSDPLRELAPPPS
jgi:hypothetical protein